VDLFASADVPAALWVYLLPASSAAAGQESFAPAGVLSALPLLVTHDSHVASELAAAFDRAAAVYEDQEGGGCGDAAPRFSPARLRAYAEHIWGLATDLMHLTTVSGGLPAEDEPAVGQGPSEQRGLASVAAAAEAAADLAEAAAHLLGFLAATDMPCTEGWVRAALQQRQRAEDVCGTSGTGGPGELRPLAPSVAEGVGAGVGRRPSLPRSCSCPLLESAVCRSACEFSLEALGALLAARHSAALQHCKGSGGPAVSGSAAGARRRSRGMRACPHSTGTSALSGAGSSRLSGTGSSRLSAAGFSRHSDAGPSASPACISQPDGSASDKTPTAYPGKMACAEECPMDDSDCPSGKPAALGRGGEAATAAYSGPWRGAFLPLEAATWFVIALPHLPVGLAVRGRMRA
jgi:hypothetical protein